MNETKIAEQNKKDLEEDIFEEEDYFVAYLGDNAEYYMSRFHDIEYYGKTVILNGYSFFLGLFWMVYKKLYIETLIVFSIITIIQFIIPANNAFDRIVGLIFGISLGCFGNYIYYKKVVRVVEKTRDKYRYNERVSQTDILDILHNKGKTDWIILVIFTLTLVSLTILGLILPNINSYY